MEKQIYLSPHTVLKGKYKIGEPLGSGSFGITYIGHDLVLDHRVAVKEFFLRGKMARQNGQILIPEEYAEEFEEEKKNFREEASLIYGAFDIPGICNIRDYFEENGTAYLVEEYLPGGTFGEFLDKKSGHTVSFAECKDLFAPVLEGLCHIHAMGIVHRDISPDNLMFTGEGQLKLIDFGAAGKKAGKKERRTGKEGYAPPEQYCDGGMTGPWSDLYAVCCVMYQALTGSRPVPSPDRMRRDTLAPVSRYASLPAKAEEALEQGMSLNIQKRYFYVGNLMENLEMDTENVKPLLGKIRSVWGEDWLQIITEKNTDLPFKSRRILTGRRVKQLSAAVGALLLAGGMLAGGLWYYGNTHPEEVFLYRLERARAYDRRHPARSLLLEGTEEFDDVLEKIQPYERAGTWEQEDYHSYDVPAAILKKMKFLNVGVYNNGKFYLDGDTVREIFEYFLGQKLELKSSSYHSMVGMEQEEGYALRTIFNTSTQRDSYGYTDGNGQEHDLELCLDPADRRVKTVSIDGNTETMELVLKDIFPYLVPEMYLTEEEITDFLASSREAYGRQKDMEETAEAIQEEEEIKNHARAALRLKTSVGKSYTYSNLTIEPNGVPCSTGRTLQDEL